MAVEARQQYPPLSRNNNHHGAGSGTTMGWVNDRGDPGVDLCRLLMHQRRQVAAGTGWTSALGNQRVGAIAADTCYPAPLSSVFFPAEFSCSMVSQIDKERKEIDQFLSLQSERLRVALQQQMRQQMLSLMRTLEAQASILLTHKEEELSRASRTTAELEERLRRSEAEGQAWQRMARESEAMAMALSDTIEQVRSTADGLQSAANPAEPAASCCSSTSTPPGMGCEPVDSWERQGDAAPAGRCRGCGLQDARVLFFPCMHLCSCELCDALLEACPICSCVKEGSMEVFIP